MSKKIEDDDKLGDLADIYNVLKSDAKTIIDDLHDGVVMWREAAAGAFASTGFIVILIFFYLTFSWSLEPLIVVRWLTISFFIVVAVVMAYIGVAGMAKYFRLRRKYLNLFERAKKL